MPSAPRPRRHSHSRTTVAWRGAVTARIWTGDLILKKERIEFGVHHEKWHKRSANADVNASRLRELATCTCRSRLRAEGWQHGWGARACECVDMAGATGEFAPVGRACTCSLTLLNHALHTRTDWRSQGAPAGCGAMSSASSTEDLRTQTIEKGKQNRERRIRKSEQLRRQRPAADPCMQRRVRMFLCTDRILCSGAFVRAQ